MSNFIKTAENVIKFIAEFDDFNPNTHTEDRLEIHIGNYRVMEQGKIGVRALYKCRLRPKERKRILERILKKKVVKRSSFENVTMCTTRPT